MKKLIYAVAAIAGLSFGPLRPAIAADLVYNAELVSDSCIGASTNYDLSLAGINQLSFVAAYSTTTPASKTFGDGRKSTATITVTNFSGLNSAKATVRFTIVNASSTTWRNVNLTLNGVNFREGAGKEWTAVNTATGTAIAIAAAIDAHSSFDAVAVSTVVYTTATVAGAYANSWAATTSAPTTISTSAPTFTGGQDNERLAINGVVLDAGTGFTAATSSAATAHSICAAVLANATLSTDITCSTTPGIVTLTATAVGTGEYSLFTSTPPSLTINGSTTSKTATMINGLATKVDLTNNLITIAAHGWGTGLDVLYTKGSGTAIGGLTTGTTYFVIKSNYDQIKLATTKALAAAGTAIDLTSQQGGNTHTLAPLAMTGSPGFLWQASNNNTFVNLSVSSVTISGTSTANWDFGVLGYKTLRLKYNAPTTGCAQVTATGTGRR